MATNESYKHFIPQINLSIEKNTTVVPCDGKFYIVKEGKIVKGFRTKKAAEELFKDMVKQSGFKPEPQQEKPFDAATEALERYAMAKDQFWAEGARRKKGGRGRGGV